jgi:hypothetical protein
VTSHSYPRCRPPTWTVFGIAGRIAARTSAIAALEGGAAPAGRFKRREPPTFGATEFPRRPCVAARLHLRIFNTIASVSPCYAPRRLPESTSKGEAPGMIGLGQLLLDAAMLG